MDLIDGRLYTPEEVCEAGWLGSDTTPEALRKGTRRKTNPLPFTRFPPTRRGRIHFTRGDILAIQEAGRQSEKPNRRTNTPTAYRTARTPAAEATPGVTVLRPRPDAARKSRRKAS